MPKKCFVIMPFRDELVELYIHCIRPAAEEAGFECSRSDQFIGSSNITKEIINNIIDSDVIIADLSLKNPNVFYELGIAHSLCNKTIMVSNRDEEFPFDIKAYRLILYETGLSGGIKLKDELTNILKNFDLWMQNSSNPVLDSGVTKKLAPVYNSMFANNGISPVVTETNPSAGDDDVDYLLDELRICFSKPMNDSGFSICYEAGGYSFPTLVEGENPIFSPDKKTVTQKIHLLPNKKYVIWINLPEYFDFKDVYGNIALPYVISFKTRKS